MITAFIRRFLQAILPAGLSEDMERESRDWHIQCSNCKFEKSVWDYGGIRWKAAGNPRVYRFCANCNQKNWHLVYKKSNA
jgi:hypothetical protein